MLTTTGHDRPPADARPPNAGTPSAQVPTDGARKRTGGLFGRLPKALVLGRDRAPQSPEVTFLLAYRCLHTGGWGCSHAKVAETVRAGFSRGVFQRAVKEATDAGLLEREQGKRKRAGRGRGYAVDRTTFDRPEANYVLVERDLFDGTLTPTEITAVLYLRASSDRFASTWQLLKRLGVTRPTVSTIMRGCERQGHRLAQIGLVARGIAKNYGTVAEPLWGLVTLKNPALNTTALKRAALKRTARTRKTYPSHQISPPQVVSDLHTGASPSPGVERRERTDCVQINAALPQLETARASSNLAPDGPERIPISEDTRKAIEALGCDVEELYDRALAQKAKGRNIGNLARYVMRSAQNEAADRLGIPLQALDGVHSRNEWAKGAALARAMGGRAIELPTERARSRVDSFLKASGFDPTAVFVDWQAKRRAGTVRADYPTYADALRANKPRRVA